VRRLIANPRVPFSLEVFLGFLFVALPFVEPEHRAQQPPSLVVRYRFTAEATYQDILVEGAKLRFTYFEDVKQKCAQWIEQSPCWTPADLTAKEATLSEEEGRDLLNPIQQSKFMELENVYGGAKEHQRYYAQTLTVELGGTVKEVTYQSFPDAAPPPELLKASVRSCLRSRRENLSGRNLPARNNWWS